MLSRETLENSHSTRERFQSASPFPHVYIDGFLEADIAEILYESFPPFDPERARNEFGQIGTNCCINDIWNIGKPYKQLYDFIQSPEFTKRLSELTGIPDLIADPELNGGGTHDNQEGHELDPHLDFNLHGELHRRINVLIYMNKGWRQEWGGAIELFENGRDTENSPSECYNCEFNRCVIFETSEMSWHGFRKIRLPNDQKDQSRRLISLYYYTKTRPGAEELVHRTTFFCPYFPEQLLDDKPLSDDDRGPLKEAIRRRDRWLQFYQEHGVELQREIGGSLAERIERAPFAKVLKQTCRVFFLKVGRKLKLTK